MEFPLTGDSPPYNDTEISEETVEEALRPDVVNSGNSTGAVIGVASDGADHSAGEDIIYNLVEFGDRYKTDESSPRYATEISDEEANALLENPPNEVEDSEHVYVTEVFKDLNRDERMEKALERTREAFRENYDPSYSGLPSHPESFEVMGQLAGSPPEMKEKE
ncbi:hypothetical protein GLU64_01685 [Nanohaloarchaea archaeon]|nr:hypothetical protein [Candidatus Nanohaloarchaea archaeon]